MYTYTYEVMPSGFQSYWVCSIAESGRIWSHLREFASRADAEAYCASIEADVRSEHAARIARAKEFAAKWPVLRSL